MSLLGAFVLEPFSVNQPLSDSLLLEPDAIEVFLADRAEKGSGTAWDPYGAQTATIFDALMNSFPPNTTVHLGAGTFQTNGYAVGVSGGWQPKRGFRIVGAGIDVTTLKLVGAATADKQYFAIGGDDTNLVHDFEALDFTVDCNLNNISTAVAAGAVKAFGDHIRIRRIRAINFGTKTAQKRGAGICTAGAFPENPEPFDCVIEDCVIEQPFPDSVRESICIELAGGENSAGVMAHHRGCVVRDCIINCMYSDREAPAYEVTLSAGNVIFLTKNVAHGRTSEWAVITGALLNDSVANRYNGTRKVTDIDGQRFSYPPDAYAGLPALTVEPAGDIYVGRAPCHRVGIQDLTEVSGLWTLTTRTPHNRLPAQKVVLNNVPSATGNFNASFPIDSDAAPFDPVTVKFGPLSASSPDTSNGWIGVDFYGILINGGRSIILENNRILNTTFGVYHAQWSTRDAIIRDNYFYNVLSAVYFKLGQVSGGDASHQPTRAGLSLTRGGTGNKTATFTTVDAHGLSVGQGVVIGSIVSGYNGMFVVDSVPAPNQFTYKMSADPGSNLGAGDEKFGALWQAGRLIIENNIMEIILPITGTPDAPTAIRLERKASTPAAPDSPYVFQQVFIRSNTIRHADDVSDTSGSPVSRAIQLQSCAAAIVEDNIIRLDRATSIEFSACAAIKFFNNESTAGKLIQGYRTDTGAVQLVNELETDVDFGLASIL